MQESAVDPWEEVRQELVIDPHVYRTTREILDRGPQNLQEAPSLLHQSRAKPKLANGFWMMISCPDYKTKRKGYKTCPSS